MKKTILSFAVLALLAACNTISGAGQDIKDAGQWTSSTADKTKEKMQGK